MWNVCRVRMVEGGPFDRSLPVKRAAYGVCAMILLLLLPSAVAGAQEAGPTLEIALGFDGYCRGAWCPVSVVIANEASDIEGELRLFFASDGDVYAREVVLPAHSRKAYTLLLPFETRSTSRLNVRLSSGDQELASDQVRLTWLEEDDRLCGVVASDPSALSFLGDLAPAGGEAVSAVAALDLATLPPDPLGWEGLSVLVLSDTDTAALDPDQRRALEIWVAHGGHLIVGSGASSNAASGVADLLPVVVGGTRSVDELTALGELIDAPVAPGPYPVSEAVLRDGTALIQQSDLILLARRELGMGRVDFLAFEAGLNPFASPGDNVRLWRWILEAGDVGTRPVSVRNSASAQSAVNIIPELSFPSTGQILAFMLVYTVLIGPINYLVLRKTDRRELAWLTIPLLILLFALAAYFIGLQIRGGSAIVHELAVVVVPGGSRMGRVMQVVGIFSPRRTHYDVHVREAGARSLPVDSYSMVEGQPLHVFEEAGDSTLDALRVDVGGIWPFVAEGYAEIPPVESDLRLVKEVYADCLVGTIRNGEIALEDAVLLIGNDVRLIGDLEPGAVHSLDRTISQGGLSFQGIPERVMVGAPSYWDDPETNRRYQFLQALFGSDTVWYGGALLGPMPVGAPYGIYLTGEARLEPGVYLVGWADGDAYLPVTVVDQRFSTLSTVLYIFKLPVLPPDAGAGLDLSAGLFQRDVVASEGYVTAQSSGFYLEANAELILRFTAWPDVMIHHVDMLTLEATRGYPSTGGGSVAISLWDWRHGRWELVDADWGVNRIPGAGDYVSSSGSVLVDLQAGSVALNVDDIKIAIEGR